MLRIPKKGHARIPYIPGFAFANITQTEIQYVPAETHAESFRTMPGQIQRGTPFGDELYKLARDGPRLWLETGTWNGLGSTQCILDGFLHRSDDPSLLSLEIDPHLAKIAREHVARHPVGHRAQVAVGRLGSAKALPFPTISDLPPEEKTAGHFILYYEQELNLYHTSDVVTPSFSPEVAVLDGGEYSGGLDWQHVDKSKLQYLCLDDAHTYKNKAVIASLGSDWVHVISGRDRNGWAIYKRT